MRTYYGVTIWPHDPNSMGLRWTATIDGTRLRADTLDGIRELIRRELGIAPVRRDEARDFKIGDRVTLPPRLGGFRGVVTHRYPGADMFDVRFGARVDTCKGRELHLRGEGCAR